MRSNRPVRDSLKEEVESLLAASGVFDIDHYGWRDDGDVDQEFVGYAMWIQNPPYEHDFESWQRDTRPSRSPSAAEQRLIELGNDFFGLMKASRHFVGLAL